MVVDDTAGSGDRSDGEKDMNVDMNATEDPGDVEKADAAFEAVSPAGDRPKEAEEPSKISWEVIFLCLFGFMASMKPGESFITPYLLSVEKNFTREQVTNEVTPVLTYSYMAMLVPAFLLTDYLRYKPVLILQTISQVVIWIMLLLCTTLLQMQFMEFFYGVTMACRVAYSSYIFSLVTPKLYQRVAGFSRSSILLGVFTSSVMGQLCMSLGNISFYTLNSITLGFVIFSFLISLFLPWPKHSLFFNPKHSEKQKDKELVELASRSELDKMNPKENASSSSPAPPCSTSRWKDSIFVQMLLELKNAVKKPDLRLWSLWWIFNSTGYYLVLFYVHILWNKVYPATENKHVYNGGVEAASTLLSTITSFSASFVVIRWKVWSELVIGVITAVQAGLLLLMYNTDNIWVCYASYIIFRGFYQFLVPIATSQIASSLIKKDKEKREDREGKGLCALVFGINTFLGILFKSIIILIFADKRVLGLEVHSQFLVYFIYFTILTVAYFFGAAVVIVRHCRNRPSEGGGTSEQALPTEPCSDAEALSNGRSAKA